MANSTRYFDAWMAKCYQTVMASQSMRAVLIGAKTEEEAVERLKEELRNGDEQFERIELVRVLLMLQQAVPLGEVRWFGRNCQ